MKALFLLTFTLLISSLVFADNNKIFSSESMDDDRPQERSPTMDLRETEVPYDYKVVCRKVGTSYITKCCDNQGRCWIETTFENE